MVPRDPVRVLLVNDQPVMLRGLAAALEPEPDIEVAAQAATAADAERELILRPPDVALVDLHICGALQLVSASAARFRTAWVVTSSVDKGGSATTSLKSGAAGYVLTTSPLGDFVAAIRSVAAGGSAFEARHLREANGGRSPVLNTSERRLVAALVAGCTNDQISHGIGVARKTVEARLRRLYQRFEVASRTELAIRAEREGWLDSLEVAR